METWTFQIDEPIVGFTVHARPWTDRAKRYVAFKARVRMFADVAGVPEVIPENHRAVVSIAVAWKKRARIDLSNVLKAVEDGLWAKDRAIEEVHAVKFQNSGIERVSVTVGMRGEKDGKPEQDRKLQA
jgi:Holliday junction resolvase RusA-like endonuclease